VVINLTCILIIFSCGFAASTNVTMAEEEEEEIETEEVLCPPGTVSDSLTVATFFYWRKSLNDSA
jgi:hypothetical protein